MEDQHLKTEICEDASNNYVAQAQKTQCNMTDCHELLFGNRSERLNFALKLFDKTREDLEQDVQIMKQWVKTQPHLSEMPRDAVIINMLILNKFSIEKCKVNLEMYYSLRPLIPELFENKHPKLPHMKLAAKTMQHVTMPNATKEGYKITYVRIVSPKIEDFSVYDVTSHSNNLLEIRLMNDVMVGEIFVIDMKNYTFAHTSKVTPIHVKKIFAVVEKAFKNSIKQMHYINVSSYVEALINLIKQVVKAKIANRIFAHKSIEDLKKYLPIDLIPKEYGGNGYSLEELQEMWMFQLEKHQYRFDELANLKIDLSKRPAPLINDEILGFHGNFKKLNVD